MDRSHDFSNDFFDRLYGTAVINIGAEITQEITIAILAEILTVIRNQKPISLKHKIGRIHQ